MRALAVAVLLLALGATGRADAAVPSVFTGMDSPPVACDTQASGQRWCTIVGKDPDPTRVRSWDGTPIDVTVALPPAPATGDDGNFPAVGIFHGWGGSKAQPGNANVQNWLSRGYAVFSMTDRGWGQSCGTEASRTGLPAWATCAHGYIHMDHQAYEERDAQLLLGELVDEGVVDPGRIGVTGASYGGILAAQLGALKNRVRLPDGSLVPWTSPDGTPMAIAAATPQAFFSDFADALIPNGSSLDYAADAPYRGPMGDLRVGIQKQAILNGFYQGGLNNGFYADQGADPSADITGWRAATLPPGPFDTPAADAALDELLGFHSAATVDDDTVAPAPMLMANGLWDDFVPADESVRLYNQIRSHHPSTPVGLFFGDFGHARSNDKAADMKALQKLQQAWMDFYVRGVGSEPAGGLDTFALTCPKAAADEGPFHFASYADLQRGEIRLTRPAPQTIKATGTKDGVALAATSCSKVPAADNPATANYRTAAAPAGGYVVGGAATVSARFQVTGPSDQIAARLLDVGPDGQEVLVERGVLRPRVDPDGSELQLLQLRPNVIRIPQGHLLKLELLPDDVPYTIANPASPDAAAQHPIVVRDLELRVPTVDPPGSAQGLITAPAAKVLPPGYELARDFADRALLPQTTITSGPTGPTTAAAPTFSFGSVPGATFQCRLDRGTVAGAWVPCSSPKAYPGLPNGSYTFLVRATAGGKANPVPTVRAFTVARPAPVVVTPTPAQPTPVPSQPAPEPAPHKRPRTTLRHHPKKLVRTRHRRARVTFRFSSGAKGATFRCKLDDHHWQACASPKRYRVKPGKHRFRVRAKAHGRYDKSPSDFRFRVKGRR